LDFVATPSRDVPIVLPARNTAGSGSARTEERL
jgi:hypothetical protein